MTSSPRLEMHSPGVPAIEAYGVCRFRNQFLASNSTEADVQVLGLWGRAGIGKTTLAAELFDNLLPGFGTAACFLRNVRTEAGRAGGLLKLQQELLAALAGKPAVVEDVVSGAPPHGVYAHVGPSAAQCFGHV